MANGSNVGNLSRKNKAGGCWIGSDARSRDFSWDGDLASERLTERRRGESGMLAAAKRGATIPKL